MLQLLIYDNAGDWQYLNNWANQTLQVTAGDVKRVAKKYLTPENRAVAHYLRKSGTTAPDLPDGVADLPAQQQQFIKQQIAQLRKIDDPAKLEEILGRVEEQKGQMPAEFAKGFEIMIKWIRGRIDELSEQGGE